MSQATDQLTAAVDRLTASVNRATAAIQAQAPGADDATIVAQTGRLNALRDQIDGVLPPPPAG